MTNVTIKQVEGGQTTSPVPGDALELQTGAGSYWTQVGDLPYGIRHAPGTAINIKIVPSVSSNNLVVTLAGNYGISLASTNPGWISISSYIPRRLTSAITLTISAGTNTFNAGSAELATKEIDLFVYLGYNATDGVVLGVSRWPGATQYGDFSTTATNEKYAAISTTTNAAATDEYHIIGRFAATLSAGAGYTWTVPTYTPLNLIQYPIWETRWLDWSPQFTNLNTATATIVAKYQLGRSGCKYQYSLVWGGSTAISGSVTHTLPFSRGVFSSVFPNALVRLYDAGGTSYPGLSYFTNATTALLLAQNASGTYTVAAVLSSTIPFTWTTSDEIEVFMNEYAI